MAPAVSLGPSWLVMSNFGLPFFRTPGQKCERFAKQAEKLVNKLQNKVLAGIPGALRLPSAKGFAK